VVVASLGAAVQEPNDLLDLKPNIRLGERFFSGFIAEGKT
jgi:hypothetical protein